MASLAKFIEELQELERQYPGSEVFFGGYYRDMALVNCRIVTRRLTKERKGVRWVSEKAKTVAFVVEPAGSNDVLPKVR